MLLSSQLLRSQWGGSFVTNSLHLSSCPSWETELLLYEWPTVSTSQWPLPLLHFIPKFLYAKLGYTYTTSEIQASGLRPQPLIIVSLLYFLPCRPFEVCVWIWGVVILLVMQHNSSNSNINTPYSPLSTWCVSDAVESTLEVLALSNNTSYEIT